MTNTAIRTLRAFSTIFLGVLALWAHNADAQKRPPNYSQDDMPITSFNCRDKVVGGYYADAETDCQMFHVCVHIQGVGIQDFRFLCPNETSFDQKHQICDDWFNIDCELSSSYYNDNFDLYRIGVQHEVKKPIASHKGTPIPLGPSTTIKPWQQPKKNQYDEEDDYKHSGNDLLRGSHSSNFFSNKNHGREDIEDDYSIPNVGAQRQELSQTSDVKKQKTLVRKLASKRPVTQKPATYTETTIAPSVTTSSTHRVSNPQIYNQQHYTQPSRPSQQQTYNQQHYSHTSNIDYNKNTDQQTYTQNTKTNQNLAYQGNKLTIKSRGNSNYNSYTTKAVQYTPTSTAPSNIYQRINNLTETENQDVSQENGGITLNYDSNRTYKNSYIFRQPSTAFAPKQTVSQSHISSTPPVLTYTESQRLPSTAVLQNIAQNYQQPAAVINNQLQDTAKTVYPQAKYTFATYDQHKQQNQNQNLNQYTNYRPPSSYQTTVIPQNPVSQNVYYDPSTLSKSQTTDLYHHSYSTPSYQQPNITAFDYYNYYQTSSTSAPVTQKASRTHYSASPAFNYHQQASQPSSHATQVSTTSAPKYDPYATFQKSNEKYDDDEFLKTAQSQNFKPSDLNTIYNQKKQLYINATLKAAYSVDQPKELHVQKTEPQTRPIGNSPKPVSSKIVSPQFPITNMVKSTAQYQAPLKTLGVNQTSNSHDYDYAYYDSVGSSEYDQIEPVEEEFTKIKKTKKT